ncbi:MAG: chromosomal replication initiator protein DnaA [Lachnospiraceae bacterium]|nr:chromosomal replication initiator protein DnaA [Lachnospiraceae bacterium]
MDQIEQKWDKIKQIVRQECNLSDISYRTWIEPLEYLKTEEDTVYIISPSDQKHVLDYITAKFLDFFQVAVSEIMEKDYYVVFLLKKNISTEELPKPEKKQEPKQEPSYENDTLNPKYKFETFVVGKNNQFAHSACLAVAESPGEVYNPLYIYGGPGLGKTHLMHSIGHFILEQNPNMKVLYVTSEAFMNEVIESIRSGNAASMTKLRDKYRTVDVLMIDDVQFIIGKESTQEEFFHTFNALHDAHKQIILSSDKPPKDIQTLDERFISRFAWGLTADIQTPDYETRMAILRKNAENLDIDISNDIIEYIAENITSNIRELEGALNKIVAFSKLSNSSPNMELAEEALKDMINTSRFNTLTPEHIIKMTAEFFDVRPEDITSPKRNANFVLPRQVVMYLCYDILSISYANIAKILGKKDHTTVLHGVDKIKEEMEMNDDLKRKVEVIRNKITS